MGFQWRLKQMLSVNQEMEVQQGLTEAAEMVTCPNHRNEMKVVVVTPG